MTFGDQALQWSALSARLLGWRPGEFWRSTPSELVSALRDPADISAQSPPSRELISEMMERDADG